jgi:hypothetical protein
MEFQSWRNSHCGGTCEKSGDGEMMEQSCMNLGVKNRQQKIEVT